MEQPEIQDSAVEGAAPAPESAPEAQVSDHDLDTDLLDQEQQAEDELEEELDGVKVRGKKDLIEKLKAERLMQADYTRKTQEVAEQRKAIEAQREQVQRNAQMAQQYVEEIAAAKAIDMRLQQYAQVNWAELENTDPVQAMRLQREMRELQSAKEQVTNQIAQKHQQRTLSEQQEIAKQIQEGNAVLQREIKDWGPEKAAKLRDFGISRGFDAAAMSQITDPRVVKLLHDAYTLDQLRQNAKKKPAPAPQEAPVTRINAPKAAANRDPDKMSVAEWTKWREAQIKRNK
jgi:hypothetical protein